jgi:hypothetical protein
VCVLNLHVCVSGGIVTIMYERSGIGGGVGVAEERLTQGVSTG